MSNAGGTKPKLRAVPKGPTFHDDVISEDKPLTLADAPDAKDFIDTRVDKVLAASRGIQEETPAVVGEVLPPDDKPVAARAFLEAQRALVDGELKIRTGSELVVEPDWTKFRTGSEFVEAVSTRYARIKNDFLTIGRMLNCARENLPHGEFMPMIRRELPFGEDVAEMLMAVAKKVDEKKLSADQLPPAYSIAYQIASLKEDELKQAVAEGLVRPDVKRAEIEQFKRRIRRPFREANKDRLTEIDLEIGRLQARILNLRDEAESLRQKTTE